MRWQPSELYDRGNGNIDNLTLVEFYFIYLILAYFPIESHSFKMMKYLAYVFVI